MTACHQQLVSGLLGGLTGGMTSSASGTSLDAADIRVDVDPEDVERKAWQALEKKGFSAAAVGTALRATEHMVALDGDRREAFNEQKRRRTHRALDWLILNVDEAELPEAFREEAQVQRKKRGKSKQVGKGRPSDASADDGLDQATSTATTALRLAGFPASAALAAASASGGDMWRALSDLCAAIGPDRDDAYAAAVDALDAAGAGANMAPESVAEILRNAQRDELSSLPRDKHAPRGFSPAQLRATLQFEVRGIVQLGAKQYDATLEVGLAGRDMYPFELPTMLFKHPALRFEEAAAVNAAMHRRAAEMVGQPFLASLLEWCEGDDVAEAVEGVREALREEAAVGANGTTGVPTGGHLTRTFAKLELAAKAARDEEERAAARRRQLMEINARGETETAAEDLVARAEQGSLSADPTSIRTASAGRRKGGGQRGASGAGGKMTENADGFARPSAFAPSAEERAAATERRRVASEEQAKISAAREMEEARAAAEDAAARTARAAAAVAAAEERERNNPRVLEECQRMRAELEARYSDSADPSLKKIIAQRKRLPSWAKSEELLRAVANNQVTIVAGETGCGKTTQLPQFILDDAIVRGEGARTNLICTQPRRISATSVAARVAQERGEALGKTVGYKIRLEAVASSSTRILFVTTGVLLRRLAEDPLLAGVSHIVVDEVHERSLDSDFLLVLLRDVLPHRPTLRVVLMSATLNAAAFSAYFKGAAVAQIPGFTFPVQEHYLEDILQVTGYQPNPGSEVCKKGGGFKGGGGRGERSQWKAWHRLRCGGAFHRGVGSAGLPRRSPARSEGVRPIGHQLRTRCDVAWAHMHPDGPGRDIGVHAWPCRDL